MKRLQLLAPMGLTLLLSFFVNTAQAQELIQGQVSLEAECQDQAMVWLSHQTQENAKELLLHTLIPDQGSYAFSVSPGLYEIWASTEQGCVAQFDEIKVERGQDYELNIRLDQ